MRKEVYYRLLGLLHLLIGLFSASWGAFSRNWILLPPSALILFLGVLYMRIRKLRSKQGGGILFPSHGVRPQIEIQGEKMPVKEYNQ